MELAPGVSVLMTILSSPLLPLFRALPLAMLMVSSAFPSWADLSENQAKTSLIYNLTKFVQWPHTAPDKTLTLCVYRDDSILSTLGTLADKTSKGMTLKVQQASTIAEIRNCQVLFIGRGEQANLRALSQAVHDGGTLLVSDIPDSAAAGAMVEIFLDNRRIAFKINKMAADEANLKLSSQLLNLAKAIHDQ